MKLPTNNKVTLPYGATTPPYSATQRHEGTDYSAFPNPYIYLPEQCKINFVGVSGTCGLAVDATSADGKRKYRFCHLSAASVSANQVRSEGTRVGTMGMTGLAFGKHLHFVMFVNNKRVDGDKYIKENQVNKPSATFVKAVFKKYLGEPNPVQKTVNFYTARDVAVLWESVAKTLFRKVGSTSGADGVLAKIKALLGVK